MYFNIHYKRLHASNYRSQAVQDVWMTWILPLVGAAISIMFVATKVLLRQTVFFCRDKTRVLSWQKYACCNKTLVATKLRLLRQNIFVATKVLSQQTRLSWHKFCRDKHTFVTTKDVFCRNEHICHKRHNLVKYVFVVIKHLSKKEEDICGNSCQW